MIRIPWINKVVVIIIVYFPLLRYVCGSNRNKEVQLCMETFNS